MVFKKLPGAVEVNTQSYPILYQRKVEKGKLAGQCHHDKSAEIFKIEIALDQSKSDVESTVLHEILHAISHEYKVPMSESMVLKLEKAIYGIFKQNGWKITL